MFTSVSPMLSMAYWTHRQHGEPSRPVREKRSLVAPALKGYWGLNETPYVRLQGERYLLQSLPTKQHQTPEPWPPHRPCGLTVRAQTVRETLC